MTFIEYRYIRYFDWISFLLVLLLSAVGLIFIYSATFTEQVPYSIFYKKQVFGMLSGILIYFICSFLNYETLSRIGYWLYFTIILLLLFTIFKGSIGMGGKRWIDIGFIKFQPSELAKLCFPMFITYYFINDADDTKPALKTFFFPLSIIFVSFLLIVKQPDLGTGLILIFSGVFLIWHIGLPTKYLFFAGLILSLSTPLLWHVLKPYQKKRIFVFMGYGDSKKERYQIEQSKIAVGSGGLWGKGINKGTQNKLSFLPESRTDFIFSVICEEIGFAGAILVLLLYLLLYLRLFTMIRSIGHFYAQLLCIGLMIHLLLSTLINVGMVLDLLPIVGIPLPFLSYGVTNLWVGFASLGCINSITAQRLTHEM